MSPIPKKIIAIAAALFLVAVAIYGSYLPYRKSSMYISALSQLDTIRTLGDLENELAKPLDAVSPIGQEEVVRNSGNILISVAQQNGPKSPDLPGRLIKFIDPYYQPILERGRGMSFTQNLSVMGMLNAMAFVATKNEEYSKTAEKYFLEGEALSPDRPQFLYGLFDIYRNRKDTEGVKRISSKILELWPNDEAIRKATDEYLRAAATSTRR